MLSSMLNPAKNLPIKTTAANISSAFDSIKQGLNETVEFSTNKTGAAVVNKLSPIDVKNIRANIGMSQKNRKRY